MYAVKEGCLAAVKRLLEAGADLNLEDEAGRSPLDYAVDADGKPNSAAIIIELLLRVDSRDQVEVGLLSLLQDKLKAMEDKVTCKVSMDAEVSTAFSPCGHLCCCQSCAHSPLLVKCSICRGDIASEDRIYLN